ncbi:metal ABC transporter ATP-binding protein [Micrococcoides hystricis]|uniref:Metal ABC transporter ATP-binding protein n=1 Tax=Micrococcoides hystricis TaxID=1572761 RepID=A0ABV6PBT5_9MICC
MTTTHQTETGPALELRGAGIGFNGRTLWQDVNLRIQPGEFLAVLGPNGSGKSTLLKVLLGLYELDEGEAFLAGRPAEKARADVGYIPQRHTMDPNTPLRARDLVALGLDGHRYGFRFGKNKALQAKVDHLLEAVGATGYADMPVGVLSGGEQQRLRAAQAIADQPAVLLCDEPLHSLDLYHQEAVTALLNQQRAENGTAIVFVTHEINPVLDYVDRVLYFAQGQYRLGTPDEIMTSETLTELYGAPVEVLRHNGRVLVYASHAEGHFCCDDESVGALPGTSTGAIPTLEATGAERQGR